MLIDEADLTLKGGHGGPGRASFYSGKFSGPDGGSGGKGGDVYIIPVNDILGLNQFSQKKFFQAENGAMGGSNKKTGENGQDLEIKLPLGSTIIDQDTNQELEVDGSFDRILICKGGIGGRGNFELRSSTRTTPKFAQTGLDGEEKRLKIILRLIADFGLIGLPNAGKSSLLNELTAANVKVADYPFTTLEPNLGVIKGRVLADIPGLIEGASEGKGLGIKFLKHIETVNLLLHCISAEGEDIKKDYKVVRKELGQYNPELLKKDETLLLTKSDLLNESELKKKITILKKLNPKTYPVSIHNLNSIENLISILFKS